MERCSDIGNNYCPCRLAELGACLQCKKLMKDGQPAQDPASLTQGAAGLTQGCNNCNWEGVCIYNQFIQDDREITRIRRSRPMTVKDIKHYSDQLVVLVLHCGLGFAQQTLRPGSFVFCRATDRDSEFDVPLSVLHSDIPRGEIHIALNPCGPKTTDLIRAAGRAGFMEAAGSMPRIEAIDMGEDSGIASAAGDKTLLVRGPYYSGLVGINELANVKGANMKGANVKGANMKGANMKGANVKGDNKTCKGNLIIGKGLAIASGWSAGIKAEGWDGKGTKKSFDNMAAADCPDHKDGLQVRMLLDSDKLTTDFVKDYFGWFPVSAIENVNMLKDVEYIKKAMRRARDAGWRILLLVSPFYYKLLEGDRYEAAHPNHANMCCGEGICGACSYTDEKGETVRMCKCGD